jgi:Flp pilus assembly protein TadG
MKSLIKPNHNVEKGHAVMEVALLAPWIFFLFVGTFDCGFYLNALISVQNAAESAALYTASDEHVSDHPQVACDIVRTELSRLPNNSVFAANCASYPLIVATLRDTGSDGMPRAKVTVTYQTIPLIPIPGLLPAQVTLSRTAAAKVITG